MSDTPASTGAGARLSAARKARGLSLATLAAQLKVPEARLAALEAERWSELPDGPYARGLATSFCRALGMEPREVLQLMPGAAPVALEKVAEGINRPLQLHPRQRLVASTPMLLILALLVALAAAVAMWPEGRKLAWPLGGTPAETDFVTDGEPIRMVEAPVVSSGAVAVVPATKPSAAPSPAPAAPATPAASAVAGVAPVSEQAASRARTGDPQGSVARGDQLTVLAKEETWVSIADASGTSLVARVLTPGERLQLDAPKPPLRVVLGNAPGAELSWRGQAQDLSSYHALRVARLTLN